MKNLFKPLRGQTNKPTYRLLWGAGLLIWSMGAATHAASVDWWIDISNDRVQNIKSELAQGEDPNVVNDKGQPALMQAIQDGAWNTYDLLVSHRNIDINITNKNGETPLMYLAIVGDVQRAASLIKRGAEVNRLGWTPLHYAASKGHLEMVQLLLANGALVNAPAPDGTTPLMMAAFSGKEPVVRALVQAGADVTTRNLSKLDAADWAESKGFSKLAQKITDLSEKVQADREAKRAQAESQRAQSFPVGRAASGAEQEASVTAGAEEGAVKGVSADPSASSATSQKAEAAAEKPWYEQFRSGSEAGGKGHEESPVSEAPLDEAPAESSTSRYFDLNRFKD